jgi:hypothetical protein
MSTKAIDYKVILKRDGQTQQQRMPEWLDPDLVPVDQRNKEDQYAYLQEIAKQIKFFEYNRSTNKAEENGTWAEFFDLSIEELKQRAATASLPAHLALWNTFMEILEEPKAQLNTLTKRHLDFYYQEVLRLGKTPPVADQAYVLFELKKNTQNTLLTAGTALLAGKDAAKKNIYYKLSHDIVVNQSAVAQLKSVFVNPANKSFLHHAPIANSADGLGAVLPPANPKWNAFGHVNLPLAQVGFCLASDVLMMKEGERKVTVYLTIRNLPADAKNGVLTANLFKCSITGEKGWIGPKLTSAVVSTTDSQIFQVTLTLNISKEEPAVVAYQKATHGSDFDTFHPILQILVNNEKADFGYANLMNAELVDARIEVDVRNIKSMVLENDFGTINPKKPFTPFGSLSDKNSNFYIQHDETFSKRLKEFSVEVDWKNIPDTNLKDYFANYNEVDNTNTDFTAIAGFKDGYSWQEKYKSVQLFNTANAQTSTTWKFTNPAFPVLQPFFVLPYVYMPISINPGNTVQQTVSNTMSLLLPQFAAMQHVVKTAQAKVSLTTQVLYKPILYELLNVYKEIRKGQLQLRLNHSFLFKEYRDKYAAEIMRYSRDGGTLKLPAEPFAPEIQSISLNYTATTAQINFGGTNINDYANAEIEFFQYGVFGQMREHAYIRNKYKFVGSNIVKLLPDYTAEGNLFIGLNNLNAEDSVCLLFQVAEGSANPEKPKVAGDWSVLCDNYWKPLNNEDFIFDTSNEFLRSGVVKLVIPKEATTTNTLLPYGLLWIRISIPKDSDGVCQLLDVQSNAAIGIFDNQDNDPGHLQNPLVPASISKLVRDQSAIKKVSQPYSSFGGKMQENDHSFYIRVSERLRHKERSIALWDYERLILHHFPQVHKVKCINHATTSSFYAPGKVLIVVVPDLTNRNAVDPFKPKVDKNTLDEIYEFLKGHASAWADFQVINPMYEPVKVSVQLKLKRGYEFNYYEQVLNQQVQEFLSPWVSNTATAIHFGGKVTKSMIIKFLEDLPFVDYLTKLSLQKLSPALNALGADIEVAEASNPASILVSAMQHNVSNSTT